MEAVELTHLDTGQVERVDCDTVVFTADWIPDHELAVLAGAALDRGTRGPVVDPGLRTTKPGVFAAGNLLHGAETADVAAISGRHVVDAVLEHLAGATWPASRIPVNCEDPLHWIVPNAVVGNASSDPRPPRGRYLIRAKEELRAVSVEILQDRRVLYRGRLPRLMPGRSASLDPAWTTRIDPAGGPVAVRVRSARRPR